MEWKSDTITVSVEDCGNYIQLTQPGLFEPSCKISFRPEQVDLLNQWLSEARSKALELQESSVRMVDEGGPVYT